VEINPTERTESRAPGLEEVSIIPEPLTPFASVLEAGEFAQLLETAERARSIVRGRTVWNVSSTARGGGVAEMLASLLPLAMGAGVSVRWCVIQPGDGFFRLTKRIHNRLHGEIGDGGELGPAERARYEEALELPTARLVERVEPGDVIILHDPQTAGIAPALHRAGALVVWRCHVGVDVANDLVRSAWDFLRPYLEEADGYVFTRAAYVGEGLDGQRAAIIAPSLDVFAPKNEALTAPEIEAILAVSGLVEGGGDATFRRADGSKGSVTRRAQSFGQGPVPANTPFIAQISRWDRLKDPLGLAQCFAAYVAPVTDAHLVVAGPAVDAVSDDPEGAEVLGSVRAWCASLPLELARRVHLVCLPMVDVEENAVIVNALQRRAAIVVQKSLAEGFGLTVAEAMWKAKPIVASRVGGIQDQISNGVSGLLVEPRDLAGCGGAVVTLLRDTALAERLGQAAQRRCRDEYLASTHLSRYVTLLESLLSRSRAATRAA
jgi:trehalose synthase